MSGPTKSKKKTGAKNSKGNTKKKKQKKDSSQQKQKEKQKQEQVLREELDESKLRRIAQEMAEKQPAKERTPLWYMIIMFSMLVLGLLWIIVYYIFAGLYPIPSIGMWNITIGVGALMVSLLMMTRWR